MKGIYKTSIAKYLISACIIGNGYIILSGQYYSFKAISNMFFIFGLGALILGLYRLTRTLKFYSLLIFGWKKFIEIIVARNYSKKDSRTGEYADFLTKERYDKFYIGFISIGLIMLLISAFIALIG